MNQEHHRQQQLVNLSRRGFLKLGAVVAAGVIAPSRIPGLVLFDEPVIEHPYKDWVTDKGDYYEVVVPSGRSLARECFDKPVLLLMGQNSIFTKCEVKGFTNVYAMPYFAINDCIHDANGLASTVGDRPALSIISGDVGTVSGCLISGPDMSFTKLPTRLHDVESDRLLARSAFWTKVNAGFKWRRA